MRISPETMVSLTGPSWSVNYKAPPKPLREDCPNSTRLACSARMNMIWGHLVWLLGALSGTAVAYIQVVQRASPWWSLTSCIEFFIRVLCAG
jgi:hypothetical protein